MTLRTIYRLALLLLLTACSGGGSFVSIVELPQEKLATEQSIEFEFEQVDTLSLHHMELIIRHRPDFEYQTLRLELRTISPQRKYWTDTIDIKMVDAKGRWAGIDRVTHHDLGETYRKSVQFKSAGRYNIRIKQLNATDTLRHLMAIGLIVEKQ